MSISLLHRPRARGALSAAAAVLALGALAGCGSDDKAATDPGTSKSAAPTRSAAADGPACTYDTTGQTAAKAAELPPKNATITGSVDATIKTSIGTLDATLDGENAPCTVNSFVSLADQKYFDGTSCHRLTTASSLSVLQCGDPSGTGRGGPGYSFADELSGQETYPAGTLAMANAGPDTNGSQFFIVFGDSQLPPSYTVFGSVDAASLALVTKAAAAGTDGSNGSPDDGAPVTPVDITSVTVAQ